MSFISGSLSNIWSNTYGRLAFGSLGGAFVGTLGGAFFGYGMDSKTMRDPSDPQAVMLTSVLSGVIWCGTMCALFPNGTSDNCRLLSLKMIALFASIIGGGTASWGLCQAFNWKISYPVSLITGEIGPMTGIVGVGFVVMLVALAKLCIECCRKQPENELQPNLNESLLAT